MYDRISESYMTQSYELQNCPSEWFRVIFSYEKRRRAMSSTTISRTNNRDIAEAGYRWLSYYRAKSLGIRLPIPQVEVGLPEFRRAMYSIAALIFIARAETRR